LVLGDEFAIHYHLPNLVLGDEFAINYYLPNLVLGWMVDSGSGQLLIQYT
jgi:hypothetical protein